MVKVDAKSISLIVMQVYMPAIYNDKFEEVCEKLEKMFKKS